MATVIVGTGIIGTSIAYYLSESETPSSIHLVESSEVLFASASGYAAGFLAKDWFSPTTSALGSLSFEEHKRLATEHNGKEKWGYTRSMGTSYTAARGKTMGGKAVRGDDWLREGTSRANGVAQGLSEFVEDKVPDGPRWLQRTTGDNVEIISEEGSTAQVDPLRLSKFLLEVCLKRGVQLHQPAKAISIAKDLHNEMSSIRIAYSDSGRETDITCTRLVISAGAWSPQVFRTLFPEARLKLPISSLAGHSLVVKNQEWTKEHDEGGSHAVFTTDESGYSPEVFSRMGGEIYVAGLNSTTINLPDLATSAKIDPKAIQQLRTTAKRLLGLPQGKDELEIIREGLCFRPVTRSGTPILSRIPDCELGGMKTRAASEGGVFLAAGHGPWGISMSLGTGIVMAEMIRGQRTRADISRLGL